MDGRKKIRRKKIGNIEKLPTTEPITPEHKVDPIKHVVYLMLENRSFDQKLGCFQQIYPNLEGVNPALPRFNLDSQGQKVFQSATTEKQMRFDPIHELKDVHIQLINNNDGFVKDFEAHYPKSTPEDRQNVMGYYPMGSLPATHALAAEACICDHWFASLPSSTWPNRLFALSGTSNGLITTPDGITSPGFFSAITGQNQDTIFDRLNEAKISWKIYAGDFPLSLVLTHQREPHNLENYHDMDRFFKDANGPAADFPSFTFIEPKYMGSDQNDDHPPHNTMRAEKLIADVYNAIRANPELFGSTVLVVNTDEHGGFYDHLVPPSAVPPDEHNKEYTFDQLGVRVPALIISPWVKKGVCKTVFDHTSLLKYLIDKWNLGPLGERTRHANSIADALNFTDELRQNFPGHIHVSPSDLSSTDTELEKWNENDNHRAIHAFADYLNNKMDVSHAALPEMPITMRAKAKLGHLLVKFGHFLEKGALHHRDTRIAHTNLIVKRLTGPKKENIVPEKNEDADTDTVQMRSRHR